MIYTVQRCVTLMCRRNISFDTCGKINTILISCDRVLTRRMAKFSLWNNRSNTLHTGRVLFKQTESSSKVAENKSDNNYSAGQLKKRPKKRKSLSSEKEQHDAWNVKAWATSEEYNLEALVQALLKQKLYLPKTISTLTTSLPDVIHATAEYEIGHEPREIFFFREGTVVMWNISEMECENILDFLKQYEQNSYAKSVIQSESELMSYSYMNDGRSSRIMNGNIMLSSNATNLDKYTFSNAMAQSVKLGIWEASLDNYIDSIEFVTEDLKAGKKLRMTQDEVLRKQGELFALRHSINLSSDLLDIPDFYWDRDDLERLYQEICSYFNINKRTRVINEKLNHCVELVGILATHLSDRHHIRLEWMIIILIMVEVCFEILHYIDRYLS